VHLDTLWTLNASTWQTFRFVYFPSAMAKLFDDIRVIVAMSWTYIIIAEMLNNNGGIGAMIWTATRQSRIDKVFAILFIIIFIGFIQDKIFKSLDKKIFKFKYINK
jgi:NitT/TauT family transport system permease protein